MFTGIIEEVGTISQIKQQGEAIVMQIAANKIMGDIKLGDSIAVNGVCLTVTAFQNQQFSVDVMPETVRATSLRKLNHGSKVNLERAMLANGRFGGHIVSGHVDGIGIIKRKEQLDNAVYYDIEAGSDVLKYIIYKGSVGVDGTSLTVFGVTDTSFTISIIPHTLSETVIGLKGTGDIVNIECDMLGKYIEKFVSGQLEEHKPSKITERFLTENGFK